jgi:Family of unknown function (DUF5681)
MAKPPKSPKASKPAAKSPESYPVGYGKPPKSTQFQPGQSGNPSGASKKVRARKAEGLGSAFDQGLLEEGDRTLVVIENGKRTKVPIARAITRNLMFAAAKGDRSAQKLVLARELSAYDRLQALKTERFGLLVQYVTNRTLASSPLASSNSPEVQSWPHPADIELDYATCTGRVVGPISMQQAQPFLALVADYRLWKARYDQLLDLVSRSNSDMQLHCAPAISAITRLLKIVRDHMPPSFKVQLDWDDDEAPAGVLDLAGLVEGQIVNLATLEPTSDELAYGIYQLVTDAMTTSRAVRGRVALKVDANTASLINRLRIERENGGGGAPAAPTVPDFDDYYGDFASEAVGDVDGTEP